MIKSSSGLKDDSLNQRHRAFLSGFNSDLIETSRRLIDESKDLCDELQLAMDERSRRKQARREGRSQLAC